MTSLMLWALPEPPPAHEGAVALWQQFLPEGATQGVYSLPQEVHQDRDRLRAAYLAWLHEVGQRPKRGRSLRDRMQIRPRLSYWWMTLPADFSLEPDSPAYRAVRLMAFAHLADRLEARRISVATRDRSLARAVAEWGRATGRQITVIHPPSAENAPRERGDKGLRQSLYRALPPLAAARVLASAIRSPKHGHRQRLQVEPGGITFVDYLAHLGPKARLNGEFDSNYWGPLVRMLDEVDDPITWIHIAGEFATRKVVRAAEDLVATFNVRTAHQTHDLLHSRLTWGVIARSLRDYFRIAAFGLQAGHRRQLLHCDSVDASLWPMIQSDFRDDFYGRTAMLNALWLNVFEEAIGRLPHQRLGIYLFENQPWEMAFLHAWRLAGHGPLIGVGHTTAVFWSTRMFKDPRDMWSCSGEAPMPWPDAVAVNGPLMREACSRANYPADRLLDVESLRFTSLGVERTDANTKGAPSVLILGEYSRDATERLIELTMRALAGHPGPLVARVRLHPTHEALATQTPGLTVDDSSSLAHALGRATWTVCGAQSSVAVESSTSGLPTLLITDPYMFVSSPAEGLPLTALVTAERQISDALGVSPLTGTPLAPGSLFHYDPELRRWRSLLS